MIENKHRQEIFYVHSLHIRTILPHLRPPLQHGEHTDHTKNGNPKEQNEEGCCDHGFGSYKPIFEIIRGDGSLSPIIQHDCFACILCSNAFCSMNNWRRAQVAQGNSYCWLSITRMRTWPHSGHTIGTRGVFMVHLRQLTSIDSRTRHPLTKTTYLILHLVALTSQ